MSCECPCLSGAGGIVPNADIKLVIMREGNFLCVVFMYCMCHGNKNI